MVILPFSFIYFQAYDSGRVVLLFTFIWLKQDLLWEFLMQTQTSDHIDKSGLKKLTELFSTTCFDRVTTF